MTPFQSFALPPATPLCLPGCAESKVLVPVSTSPSERDSASRPLHMSSNTMRSTELLVSKIRKVPGFSRGQTSILCQRLTRSVSDRSGKLCNAIFRDAANIDPLNQVVTATPKTSFECNSCYLTMLATRLQMPLASNPIWESAFTYLTSSCGISTMTLTPPVPSTWIVP